MERISAACAMEWSIDLEKGLRSKVAGGPVEAILQIGQRLEQWNREPEPTLPVYKMFGLVPGEDRLFANAILLRLAEAFRVGDHSVRHSVVRVFLSLRSRNKNKYNGGKNYGILSKHRVHNQSQLLSRVKIVFDSGDVQSRALTLVLFGCWADFAKDSAEIRYIILSSLVSSHVVEVGLKLLMDSSEEHFLVAMLISLSKLASIFSFLISEQVDLLCSFLTQEKTLHVKAMAIRCLHFIFIRSMCHFPVSAYIVKILFSMLDDPELPSDLQCQALRIFHKIALYSLANGRDILELDKLLTIVDNASKSPITLKQLLVIRVLVDISGKLRERIRIGSDGADSTPLLSQIIAFVIDQVTSLVKPMLDLCCTNSEVEKECQCLFSLLLLLVEEHPDLGVLALDKIHLFIEYLVNMHDGVMSASKASLSVNEIVDSKGKTSMFIMSKLAIYVYRFVVSCLEHLKETGSITTEVVHKVKLLVEHVHRCSLFDCYIHMIYSLLLYSCIAGDFVVNENKETNNHNENLLVTLDDHLIEHETLALECAEKIFAGMDYWDAYKAGKYAAHQGAWFTASFIFERLMTKVQSDSCHCWLKSLAQFSHSEKKIQLILLPKQGSSLVNWLQTKKVSTIHFKDNPVEIALDAAGNINLPNCYEKLVEAYSSLCSSLEALESIVKPGQAFCFQRWFLALRVKVLAAVVDIVKLLGTVPFNQDKITNEQVKRSILVEYPQLSQQISQVSFQLKRLAQEFDLMATSFIGMDSKSSKIISALALSCSILAFITGFTLYFPEIPVNKNVTTCSLEGLGRFSHSVLIQDLIGRLWHMDHEMIANLCLLLKASGQPKSCCHLQSGNQIWSSGCGVKDVLTVCRYAVTRVVHLQNEANKGHNEEDLSQLTNDGWQCLLDVVTKWMHIPFQTPKYFFQIRQCVGSELFASSTDTRSPDGISILPGFHLSLNLCLQLKNVPPDRPIQLTKLYCILYCKASFGTPKPIEENKQRMQSGYHSWEIDDMIDLNESLFQHVTEDGKTTNAKLRSVDNGDGGVVKAFVCFEPNERGQGFSTCLLDVSGFPVGSYKIKWHSCCVDDQGSYWSLLPLNAPPVFTLLDPLHAPVTTK
ncbi:uncharacterized protein LOC100265170 isoform X2 [Vitis vinifera]|uniref:uncharacterized protein LOC100265170 isoform X2 n=1 Tax=Vitis vinifera TaxID=29760 RepID=UPI002882F6DD|nr:uncharacterized protein LOC100265170 isoform X2 [Vitis vinifera]